MSRTISCTVPTAERAEIVANQWRRAGYAVTITPTDDGPVIVTGERSSLPDVPLSAREIRDTTTRMLAVAVGLSSILVFLDVAVTLIAKAGVQ